MQLLVTGMLPLAYNQCLLTRLFSWGPIPWLYPPEVQLLKFGVRYRR